MTTTVQGLVDAIHQLTQVPGAVGALLLAGALLVGTLLLIRGALR